MAERRERIQKPEEAIRLMMVAFILQNGMQDADVTTEQGRFLLVTPNRFGLGYIVYVKNRQAWSANLNGSGEPRTPRFHPHGYYLASKGWLTDQTVVQTEEEPAASGGQGKDGEQ